MSMQHSTWGQQEPDLVALSALSDLQWSVFPLDQEKRPPQTGGTNPDGTPERLAWKFLQKRRPSVKELQLWQKVYRPSAWAVVTGEISHLVILDFDGEIGRKTCERLGLRPHVQTGSGGLHVYFQHPGWQVSTLNGKSKRALGEQWPGLDIRGDGGYAAFCGCNSSGPYVWLRDPIPDDLSILPDDLRTMLELLHPPESEANRRCFVPSKQPLLLQMPANRLRLAEQLTATALEQSKMGRNNAGFRLACELRDHKYSWEQAQAVICEYASRVSPHNSKGQLEPYTESEAMKSLASAYRRTSTGSGSSNCEDLPNIILTDAQLPETVDQCIKAIELEQSKSRWLFIRSSRLVNVAHDEQKRLRIYEMGVINVTGALIISANFFTVRMPKDPDKPPVYTPARPPREISEQILARVHQKPFLPFPPLLGLTEVPILRPDGSICDRPGYDPETQLYYMPPTDSKSPHVPTNPTARDVKEALDLIWDLFGEFCYASEADRANTLALLMTPIIRPAIKGDVPLAGIDACKAGSGKGILAHSVAMIATGRSASILTPPSTEEEWGKCLMAMLMEGQTVICIDNVIGRLQSAKLDGVLTSEISQGRVLGQSATAHVPNMATWIATGNNLQLGGDLARRSYWIRLDPKMSRPWMRKGFRYPNLVEAVRQRRMELVRALLILIRVWYVSGQPQASDLPAMGTFSPWVQTIGSILAHVGVPGFLGNQLRHYEATDEISQQWETFLQAWYDKLGSNWVKVADIIALMNEPVTGQSSMQEDQVSIDLAEALPERLQILFQERPNSFKNRLGQELKKRVGERFGENNLHLEHQKQLHTKVSFWRVIAGNAGNSPSDSHRELF